MGAVVHRAGEGEALFGGRIVLKAAFEQLTITESWFATARPGAGPHIHHHHADSFYVLDGELGILVDDDEHRLGPGGCACLPAGVVHAFRSTTQARFLNIHTPDGGFADNLRALNRGEPGGFDSVDAEDGGGLPGSNATLLHTGAGERREIGNGVATAKIERAALTLFELVLEPGFEAPEHADDGHVGAYYVLDGKVELLLCDEKHALGIGSFVALPQGTVHSFASGPGGSRLLDIRAPTRGGL